MDVNYDMAIRIAVAMLGLIGFQLVGIAFTLSSIANALDRIARNVQEAGFDVGRAARMLRDAEKSPPAKAADAPPDTNDDEQ